MKLSLLKHKKKVLLKKKFSALELLKNNLLSNLKIIQKMKSFGGVHLQVTKFNLFWKSKKKDKGHQMTLESHGNADSNPVEGVRCVCYTTHSLIVVIINIIIIVVVVVVIIIIIFNIALFIICMKSITELNIFPFGHWKGSS